MRIVVVSTFYPGHLGGLEIVAGELAQRLAALGHQVVWHGTAPAPAPAISSSSSSTSSTSAVSGPIIYQPEAAFNFAEQKFGVPYPIWTFGAWKRLYASIKNADLVHVHDCLYLSSVMAFLLAKILRRPLVVTQHIALIHYQNLLPRLMMRWATALLSRIVLSHADRVVFCSHRVMEFFKARIKFKASPQFIANGVDGSHFRPASDAERDELRRRFGWSKGQKVVLFVGRFVEKKGLHLVLAAAQMRPDIQFVLIGSGPLEPESWNLPNVRCVSPVHQRELRSYYQASDLLLLPSHGEGFPLVVQEAMASGLKAAISAETMAGDPRVQKHVVPVDLAVSSIVQALGEIPLAGEGERRELAAFSREMWSWETCIQAYERCFAECEKTKLPAASLLAPGRRSPDPNKEVP